MGCPCIVWRGICLTSSLPEPDYVLRSCTRRKFRKSILQRHPGRLSSGETHHERHARQSGDHPVPFSSAYLLPVPTSARELSQDLVPRLSPTIPILRP